MSSSGALTSTIALVAVAIFSGCVRGAETTDASRQRGEAYPNVITGENLPNPNPSRIAGWATKPTGREWGSSAGIAIDPTDGHVWGFERCGSASSGAAGVNCDNNPLDPIFKFDRNTGEILAMFGAGVVVTPHGMHVDNDGNVWVADVDANEGGTKGHQVHKFSPSGELLLSLGTPGQAGSGPNHLHQPTDVIIAPDGSIFVSDGHHSGNMTSEAQVEAARAAGLVSRIVKYSPEGEYILEWGEIGTKHGQFRTPHAIAFDSRGRLWVADRGNHRLEIFDQQGNYLESRYLYGRISDIFITNDDRVYAIDSESHPFRHPNWRNGVRIGHVDRDWVEAFIPPWESARRPLEGLTGEGVAVDADGNVYVAEGPASLADAGAAFTKYEVAR